MKRLVISLAATATLALACVQPAQANGLQHIWQQFEDHCNINTLSCSISKEHSKLVDLPDTVVPPGAATSHGQVWGTTCGPFEVDVPVGGKTFCVADYTSFLFKNGAPGYTIDGGTATGYSCTTTTGTLTHSGYNPLSGWDVKVTSNTADGHCSGPTPH